MKKSNQGENLAREWNEDPHASEIWDALQLMRVDQSVALKDLEKLAEGGSALSMMHLGHIYLSGKYEVKKMSRSERNALGVLLISAQ